MVPRCTGSILGDSIGTNWTGYVLEALLAQIGELDCDFSADLIVGRRRDTDAARFRYALKPCRNIDPGGSNNRMAANALGA